MGVQTASLDSPDSDLDQYDTTSNELNLDVTTLLAYVSALTNGSANWVYKEPLLTEQAERRRQRLHRAGSQAVVGIQGKDAHGIIRKSNGQEPGSLLTLWNSSQGHAHDLSRHFRAFGVLVQLSSLEG